MSDVPRIASPSPGDGDGRDFAATADRQVFARAHENRSEAPSKAASSIRSVGVMEVKYKCINASHPRKSRWKTEGGSGPLGPSLPLVEVDLPHVHPHHRDLTDGVADESFGKAV